MSISPRDIRIALVGGLLAEFCFEIYAWLVSPLLFGLELQPARLVTALGQTYLGVELAYPVAFAIHSIIGVIGFGLFVLAFVKLLPFRTAVSGLVAGLALWFVAQGLLAPAIGRDFMMNFGTYTQSSLVGHIGMAFIIALVIGSYANKPGPQATRH